MNVLILEDEPRRAARLAGLLTQYDPTIRVLAQLPSVAQGLAWFAAPGQGPGQPGHPDLLLLDIHLEDGTGFQLIERAGLTLPIIFTTAFDAYTLQAFKTNSVDYLPQQPQHGRQVRGPGQVPGPAPRPGPGPGGRAAAAGAAAGLGATAGPRLQATFPGEQRAEAAQPRNCRRGLLFLRRQSHLVHALAGPQR